MVLVQCSGLGTRWGLPGGLLHRALPPQSPISGAAAARRWPSRWKRLYQGRERGCLGEAQDVVLLCHSGDLGINQVITEYPRLAPRDKQSFLIKVDPGNPTHLTSTDIKPRDPAHNQSPVEPQINSIQSNLGEYEIPMLAITLKYRHSSTPPASPSLFPEP